ncbi:hypothetical protein JCM24511_08004 [Saitozyma sp. JCM 24511]|nr:hypothetical protein JCM24511_08004 [Saitozyma sp. JCM 24511]
MCPGHGQQDGPPRPPSAGCQDDRDALPDWENLALPPPHVLSHLSGLDLPDVLTAHAAVTDAHCHPTDTPLSSPEYDKVHLGALAAMATIPEDQDRVTALSEQRPWEGGTASPATPRTQGKGKANGPRVVACFGGSPEFIYDATASYHPWFVHSYTLLDPPPSKEAHYTSLFFKPNSSPTSKNRQLLLTLLPYLPEPVPFTPLLAKLREDIHASLARGQLTMLGEVGLDGGARVRWPTAARHLYTEKYGTDAEGGADPDADDGGAGGNDDGAGAGVRPRVKVDEQGEWKRLTPFKTSMAHQREIAKRQMEIAVECAVNVSFHSVAAAGPTMDVLTEFRDRYRTRFTNAINVDLHSAGGWSPEFWVQAEKQLLNLYASPSILITGRSTSAAELIRSISPDRLLVESDTHDARLATRLVWGACEWMARCRGWRLEGRDADADEEREWEWEMGEEEEEEEEWEGKEQEQRWLIRTAERNWARFMRIVE